MNPYYSGLGIARSLRGHGVHVAALWSESDAPGLRSRCFDALHRVPNGRDDPLGLRDALVRLGTGQAQKPVIFPTRDADVVFLAEHHDALAPLFVLPQPKASPILQMMDKLELARVAKGIGIDTPATHALESPRELERLLPLLTFPVIVKPRFAYEWRRAGLWQRVGGQKAFIVDSPADLRALYERLGDVAAGVLVQDYVPGDDADIVVCCCYMNAGGELLGYFTARKLRQNPPLTGTGSVIEATPVAALVEPSAALLRAFGYAGIAEIEFKRDRRSDRYCLIEINPRHWDQHELGTMVGVNISWLAYADRLGLAPSACAPVYRTGERYKWIAETEVVQALARMTWQAWRDTTPGPGRWRRLRGALAEFRELVRGRKMFATARLRDPVPGILTGLRTAKVLAGGLAAKAFRRGTAGVQQP